MKRLPFTRAAGFDSAFATAFALVIAMGLTLGMPAPAALAQGASGTPMTPTVLPGMQTPLAPLGGCIQPGGLAGPGLDQAGSIDRMMRVSAEQHPSVLGRLADRASADASLESAGWGYWPSPILSHERVNAGSRDPSYPGDDAITVVGIRASIWTGGRLDANRDRARAQVDASGQALLDQREQIAIRTALAWGDWWRYDRQIAATDKSIAAHEALQAQVDRRIEGGAAPEVDRKLTLSRLRQLINDRARLVSLRQSALRALQQLADASITAADLGRAAVSSLCLAAPEELTRQMVERNPRLARLRANLKVLAAEVDVRRASRYPEIYARLERQYGNYAIANAAASNRAFIGASWQPGAGLSIESDIRSLIARQEASDRDLAGSRLDLLEEFNGDWLSFNAIRERLDAILDALADTRAISSSYERQYQAGRKSWLDVMNLVREQLQLELQQADLEANLIVLSRKLQVRASGLRDWGGE